MMTYQFSRPTMLAFSCVGVFAVVGCSPAPTLTPQNSHPDISQEEAIAAVRDQPEVREFESTLVAAGTTAHIDAQSEDAEWLVQVYEIRDGHTATLNWYRVNKKTGQVSVEFP